MALGNEVHDLEKFPSEPYLSLHYYLYSKIYTKYSNSFR
ncbi:hypothetical protein VCRA212O16_210030 [Vibrio crassostreae]|nr:hypothetical protein VCRA212O16_210030 [Vibrio crassostreae]